MSLRVQLLLLQALIVVATVAGTGILVGALQERLLREAYLDRMTAVAQSVARLPVILDAYDSVDPSSVIQPVAEVIREGESVTYDMKPHRDDPTAVGTSEVADAIIAKLAQGVRA